MYINENLSFRKESDFEMAIIMEGLGEIMLAYLPFLISYFLNFLFTQSIKLNTIIIIFTILITPILFIPL
ncbi:hypothetical protein D2962_00990 [Biomaibacter acetigenes]|jgi:hypothetical protein|uniref:Uncharacterized protein n=1 Tax=Biomaibacter acetigenes TaxID=2316383 RepID=A0A3G2R1M9_9FIRM|nr:hypothetical protein D2962_00990 [Biomaibacter acetigenes]RKL62549.1 hypothetical protein DXT63_10975 [Thermoanaerobacteraceae bacterium SP2]